MLDSSILKKQPERKLKPTNTQKQAKEKKKKTTKEERVKSGNTELYCMLFDT